MSKFYNFVKNLWITMQITFEQVQNFVPKYISQEESAEILETQQSNIAQ